MELPQSYVEHAPLRALAGTVRTFWVQRTGAQPYAQRHLPTGGVELHCYIGALPRLLGPLPTARVEMLPPRTTVVGARFWPGAASVILDLPADELVGATVSLDEAVPGAAEPLGELLADAATPDAAVNLLQSYLLRQQERTTVRDPLVVEAVRRLMPWQPVGIGALTDHLAISTSQLRRRFLATVGVGPKTLQRTLRFQGYLALAQAVPDRQQPGAALADLAAAAGYADHAHLSRECVRLAGLPPRELLGGSSDQCGCGHDHAASYRSFLPGPGPARGRRNDARFVQAPVVKGL